MILRPPSTQPYQHQYQFKHQYQFQHQFQQRLHVVRSGRRRVQSLEERPAPRRVEVSSAACCQRQTRRLAGQTNRFRTWPRHQPVVPSMPLRSKVWPRSSAMALASSMSRATPDAGTESPIPVIATLNCSRSSAALSAEPLSSKTTKAWSAPIRRRGGASSRHREPRRPRPVPRRVEVRGACASRAPRPDAPAPSVARPTGNATGCRRARSASSRTRS